MKYRVIALILLLFIFISCSGEREKLGDAMSTTREGLQNIQAAYDSVLSIKENMTESEKAVEPEEKEELLNDRESLLEEYRSSLKLGHTNFSDALCIYNDLIQQKPKDAFILNSLGHTYMWFNQKDEANKYFEQALSFCQSESLKESIEYNKNFFPEVKKHYDLFQEIDQDYAKLSKSFSFIYQGSQDIQAAYDTAQLIQENIIEGKKNIESEEKQKLLEDYKRARQSSEKMYSQALDIYQRLVQKKPKDAFFLNSLGETNMWLNKRERAEKYFEQALEHCKARSLKLSIKSNKRNLDDAEEYYNLFQKIDQYLQQHE